MAKDNEVPAKTFIPSPFKVGGAQPQPARLTDLEQLAVNYVQARKALQEAQEVYLNTSVYSPKTTLAQVSNNFRDAGLVANRAFEELRAQVNTVINENGDKQE